MSFIDSSEETKGTPQTTLVLGKKREAPEGNKCSVKE